MRSVTRLWRRLAGCTAAAVAVTLTPASIDTEAIQAASAVDPVAVAASAGDVAAATAELCEHAPSGLFRDVGGVHADNIDCLAAYDVTVGVGGGNYDPSGSVRRGQMASFLVNFADVAVGADHLDVIADAELQAGQDDVVSASAFTDIAGSVHATNIAVAAELGITAGATPTTFDPSGHVTREQMASFVVNALTVLGAELPEEPDVSFTDVAAGGVHTASIERLAAAGVVAGVGEGRFDPASEVSRGQMATFLVHAAGYLAERDAWDAGALPPDAPELLLVTRDGLADDRVVVLWDRAVDIVGDGDDVQVFNGDGSTVATGEDAAVVAGDAVGVDLTDSLEPNGEYRLQASSGFVEDDAGVANLAQAVDFTFATAGGSSGDVVVSSVTVEDEPVADGDTVAVDTETVDVAGVVTSVGSAVSDVEVRVGDGVWESADAVSGSFNSSTEAFAFPVDGLVDGDVEVTVRATNANGDVSSPWTVTLDVDVPEELTISSVVTDPDEDRLVVTFSHDVTCPDTQAARDAWDFRNLSVIEDPPEQSEGAPSSVTQVDAPSDNCYLEFNELGIENGDFGSISYEATGTNDAVSSASLGAMDAHDYVVVNDGKAPELVSISSDSTSSVHGVDMLFSEPILCNSLGHGDVEVYVDGVDRTDLVEGFACDEVSVEPRVILESGTISEGSVVVVRISEYIYDESQDNFVELDSNASTVAD